MNACVSWGRIVVGAVAGLEGTLGSGRLPNRRRRQPLLMRHSALAALTFSRMLIAFSRTLLEGAGTLALATGYVILTDESAQTLRVYDLDPLGASTDEALRFE